MVRFSDALTFAVLALASHAAASPEAEQLFRDGRALMLQGKLAEACDRFARSHKLEPKVGTLLNLGECKEQRGLIASAWDTFLQAKALALQASDTGRAGEAARRASALEPQLSYVTWTVPPAVVVDGLTVRKNGTPLDPAAWNTTVPIDPGDYTIEATAPGRLPWTTTQTIAKAQRVSIAVGALAPDPTYVPPQRETPPVTPPAAPLASERRLYHLGAGVVGGSTIDRDTVIGVRLVGLAPAPHGAVRGVGSLYYAPLPNDTDLVAYGLQLEYMVIPTTKYPLAFAAGLGFGKDRFLAPGDDYGEGWYMATLSPLVVRVLDGRGEIGLHLRWVILSDADDKQVYVAGFDWFLL